MIQTWIFFIHGALHTRTAIIGNGGNKKPAVPCGGFGKNQILEIRRGRTLMAHFAALIGSIHARFAAGATFSARIAIGMSGLKFINAGKLRHLSCAVKRNPALSHLSGPSEIDTTFLFHTTVSVFIQSSRLQNEFDILADVSHRLEGARIPHMLTGSMAMSYYASPRMTRDIDFVVAIFPGQAAAVVNAFSPDYYISQDAVQSSIQHKSLFNAIHQQTIIKIDFIIRKDTPYRRTEFDRRKQVTREGITFWITSKEDLIISKLYWAKDSESELQLRDVRNLAETGYDQAYIDHWIKDLDLEALWKKCL